MRIPAPRNQRLIRSSDRMNGTHAAPGNAVARDFGFIANCSHSKDVTSPSKDGCQSGSSKVCPERKLAVAVFSQAANDLQKFRYARRGAGYSLYADARKWIASNDRSWPYSFLNLCDVLHLAADVIRAELLGNPSGHPSLNI
jgi:hypothetical protein